MKIAEEKREESVDLWEFTNVINQNFDDCGFCGGVFHMHTILTARPSTRCASASEHFGLGYSGTYALQMKNWVAGLDGSVQISIARFDAAIDRSVVQAVEDGLWQMDQPMFGRRGAR